jgi:histidinol-phosphate aminotransferase
MNFETLIKPGLLEMPSFRRALTIREIMDKYGLTKVTRMAMNENMYGPSPKAIEAMKEETVNAYMYPDRQFELLTAIAETCGVTPANVILNGGAGGVLNNIGDTFILPGDEVILSSIPYQQYPMVARRNEGIVVSVPVLPTLKHDFPAMLDALTEKTKMIIVCNPGNPTSVAETTEDLVAFLSKVPENVITVVDEAYLDFAVDEACKQSMIPRVASMPNLIVVKTFSKIYGLAGMRIGFAVSSPEVIACLNKGGAIGSVSRVSTVAAIAALKDTEYKQFIYDEITAGKKLLTEKLTSFGWYVYPSSTNFLYFDTGLDIDALMEELLKRGVIIRPGYLWGDRWQTWFRISTGTPAQMQFFIEKTDEVLRLGENR